MPKWDDIQGWRISEETSDHRPYAVFRLTIIIYGNCLLRSSPRRPFENHRNALNGPLKAVLTAVIAPSVVHVGRIFLAIKWTAAASAVPVSV